MNIIEYKYRFLGITSLTFAQPLYSNANYVILARVQFATPPMTTLSNPVVAVSVPKNGEG